MATEQQCSVFWLNKMDKNGNFPVLTNIKPRQAELEYEQECGKYDKDLLYCISSDAQIQGNILKLANQSENDLSSVIKNQKKTFANKGCVQILEKYRQTELGKVVDKFSGLDKARIEFDSIYQRNQRVFFGGLILVAGVVIFTMFSKKK